MITTPNAPVPDERLRQALGNRSFYARDFLSEAEICSALTELLALRARAAAAPHPALVDGEHERRVEAWKQRYCAMLSWSTHDDVRPLCDEALTLMRSSPPIPNDSLRAAMQAWRTELRHIRDALWNRIGDPENAAERHLKTQAGRIHEIVGAIGDAILASDQHRRTALSAPSPDASAAAEVERLRADLAARTAEVEAARIDAARVAMNDLRSLFARHCSHGPSFGCEINGTAGTTGSWIVTHHQFDEWVGELGDAAIRTQPPDAAKGVATLRSLREWCIANASTTVLFGQTLAVPLSSLQAEIDRRIASASSEAPGGGEGAVGRDLIPDMGTATQPSPVESPGGEAAAPIEPADRTAWECKIGWTNWARLPSGSDLPMRRAVQEAFEKLTGHECEFTFSGWNAALTEGELAVVENRAPREPAPQPAREPGAKAALPGPRVDVERMFLRALLQGLAESVEKGWVSDYLRVIEKVTGRYLVLRDDERLPEFRDAERDAAARGEASQ